MWGKKDPVFWSMPFRKKKGGNLAFCLFLLKSDVWKLKLGIYITSSKCLLFILLSLNLKLVKCLVAYGAQLGILPLTCIWKFDLCGQGARENQFQMYWFENLWFLDLFCSTKTLVCVMFLFNFSLLNIIQSFSPHIS